MQWRAMQSSILANHTSTITISIYNMDYIWDYLRGRTFSDRIVGLLGTLSLYKKVVAIKVFAAIPDEPMPFG